MSGSSAGVIESVGVCETTVQVGDELLSLYTVDWTGTNGVSVSHSATPKIADGKVLPDQTVLITEVTDRPGETDRKVLAWVYVFCDDNHQVRARVVISHAQHRKFDIAIRFHDTKGKVA